MLIQNCTHPCNLTSFTSTTCPFSSLRDDSSQKKIDALRPHIPYLSALLPLHEANNLLKVVTYKKDPVARLENLARSTGHSSEKAIEQFVLLLLTMQPSIAQTRLIHIFLVNSTPQSQQTFLAFLNFHTELSYQYDRFIQIYKLHKDSFDTTTLTYTTTINSIDKENYVTCQEAIRNFLEGDNTYSPVAIADFWTHLSDSFSFYEEVLPKIFAQWKSPKIQLMLTHLYQRDSNTFKYIIQNCFKDTTNDKEIIRPFFENLSLNNRVIHLDAFQLKDNSVGLLEFQQLLERGTINVVNLKGLNQHLVQSCLTCLVSSLKAPRISKLWLNVLPLTMNILNTASMSNLKELHVQTISCHLFDELIHAKSLIHLRRLWLWSLDGENTERDQVIIKLASSGQLTSLTSLDLGHRPISIDAFQALINSPILLNLSDISLAMRHSHEIEKKLEELMANSHYQIDSFMKEGEGYRIELSLRLDTISRTHAG